MLLVSSKEYFAEMVDEGIARKRVSVPVPARTYLVNLLEHYLHTRNLFEAAGPRTTLAEMYLHASQQPAHERIETLKRMADRSLYISGFFADSLARSLVDVDYYASMGGAAYGLISQTIHDEQASNLYSVFSQRFLEFVDILSFISQKSQVQSDADLLRLYEVYLKTGSESARQQLTEKGVIPFPTNQLKKASQD